MGWQRCVCHVWVNSVVIILIMLTINDRGSACSNFIRAQLWFFSFPYLLFFQISKIPSSGNSLMNSNEFHVGGSLFSIVCKHRILAQISLVSLSIGLWDFLTVWIQYVQYFFNCWCSIYLLPFSASINQHHVQKAFTYQDLSFSNLKVYIMNL